MSSLIITGNSWGDTFAAAPATLTHGTNYTITGSYGTRSVLRDIFDNCDATATLASRWNDSVNMAYFTQAALTTAIGVDVGLPHSNITRVARGRITSGNFNTYNAWLSTSVSGYSTPTKVFISHYKRMNPNWVFASECNTGTDNDNNHKYLVASANSVFLTPYWYHDGTGQKCNINASWGDSFHASGNLGTIEVQQSQSGGSTRPLEDPWLNWAHWEWRFGMGPSGQSLKFLINNTVKTSATGLNTDDSAITTRAFSVGGYGRSGPANRDVILADINMVIGTDAYKRVVLTNNATYTSSTTLAIQPIVSWNGNITIRTNKGALSSGAVHMHVFDSNDVSTYVGQLTIT